LRVNRVHASNALLLCSLQAETGEPEGQPSSHLPHAANRSSIAVVASQAGLDGTETHRLANQAALQRRFSCTDVEVAQSQVP
jgi:L-aminopeptidase/D-esterase-like protein